MPDAPALDQDLAYSESLQGPRWTARQYLPQSNSPLVGQAPADPSAVLASWPTEFPIERGGLRLPQAGALHSLLGYWTTDPRQPATIVMPTGTGKTDTMVAALVASRIPKLLVLVPSDALREQIAIKFERLAVLRSVALLPSDAQCPVVARLHGRIEDLADAHGLASAANVVIATAAALSHASSVVRQGFIGLFTHLFIDEAHHVAASTWRDIRDSFSPRPVVQFTATPYRRDGAHLGGSLIYSFPLREAQRQGYFSTIRYQSVVDPVDPDRSVATHAIAHLREDLESGFDHLLMARAASIKRANELLALYAKLAPDLSPVVAHHQLGKKQRASVVAAMRDRTSRVLVCVDMFGEGFDLPQLKVAALHDQHRSLGVTLQFVGRFARSGEANIGAATVVSARSELRHDPALRRLYAEDADWDVIIEDLSAGALSEQSELDEFAKAFGNLPDQFSIHALSPAMSTVVFRPSTLTWRPDRVTDVFPESALRTYPIPTNERDHVLWFVVEKRTPSRWGDADGADAVAFHLYVVYWDESARLLYIHSSDNDSTHEPLARAVSGDADVSPIRGEVVYRAFHNVQRLTPTNVGLLDARSRSRRFTSYVGSDVTEGLPTTQSQTKTQTHIAGNGFLEGTRYNIAASLKGRIWSHRTAAGIKQWVDWCDVVGGKLVDNTISVDEIMAGFIRPESVERWPDLHVLAIELPAALTDLLGECSFVHADASVPFYEVEFEVGAPLSENEIALHVISSEWEVDYRLRLNADGLFLVPEHPGVEVVVQRPRSESALSELIARYGLRVILAGDALIEPPGLLLRPQRVLQPFPPDRLQSFDWGGIDIRRESWHRGQDPASVQGVMINELRNGEWDVIIDDDGSGEVADIVAMRIVGDTLRIRLVHCKFSTADAPGARLADLYEVVGQAARSGAHRRDVEGMIKRLLRRERNRQQRDETGLIVGTFEDLHRLLDESVLLRATLTVVIAQPGLSASAVNAGQLELLAGAEVYLMESAHADLEVICSP